jgi:glycosyltransferase involved in cell wall biosynthesis
VKIAFVVPSLGLQEGQGNINLELLRRVAGAGHSVDVYSSLAPDELLTMDGVTLHRLARLPAWQLGNQFMMLTSTTARVRRGRYDLVHADAGMTLKRADVLVCHTITDRWYELPDEVWHEPGVRGANQAAATKFKARLELRQYRAARRVLVGARSVADDLIVRGVDSERIEVIEFGVDAHRYRPPTPQERAEARAELELADRDFVVAFVGAHGPRKGLPLALEALEVAAPGEVLVVAGERRSGEWASYAADRSLPVRMPGKVEDIHRIFWAADVLAYPSRYDAFGMAVLEAMACGLPVVVAKEAGSHEIVRDAGIILAEHNVASLRGALDALRFDPDRRRAMGERARQIAAARTWDKAGQTLLDLYARLK